MFNREVSPFSIHLQMGAGIPARVPQLPQGISIDCVFSLVTKKKGKKYFFATNYRPDLE